MQCWTHSSGSVNVGWNQPVSSSTGGYGENHLHSLRFAQYAGRSFKNTKEIKFPLSGQNPSPALWTARPCTVHGSRPLSVLTSQASLPLFHLPRLCGPWDLQTHWFQHCPWLPHPPASGPAPMSPQTDHPISVCSGLYLPSHHLTYFLRAT